MSVLKNGSASTLAIVAGIRQRLEDAKATLPDNLKIAPIGDQSIFVRAAISGVAREGIIAAALTSLMILLFLGSWRSTVIIAVSIPLAILSSIAALSAIGETLNIMTLGGLALAVGILVDDATVTIENINWHLEQGKQVEQSILDGAQQIVTPAFVSLLCICIVFVPMFFLEGVARFLFVPMAESVIFAMIASFILSRTLVPTMAKYLLHPHVDADGKHEEVKPTRNPLVRFQRAFEARFEKVRASYHGLLALAMEHRRLFVTGFMVFVVLSFALVPTLGRNFFPDVDAGQILMHVRAPVGTRLEQSAQLFAQIQRSVKRIIPAEELGTVVDNIGLSNSGINNTYNNTGTIGEQDGDIQIALNEGHHPTADYVRQMREKLPHEFPGVTFSFPPADIVSQILNFGSPAPIALQIRGPKLPANFKYADTLLREIKRIPGIADARIQESQASPGFKIDMDRTQAQLLGITARDVTNSLVVNLAGSSQVAPTFWLNPQNDISYPIVLQDAAIFARFPGLAAQPVDHRQQRQFAGARRPRHGKPAGHQRSRRSVQHSAGGADLRHHPGSRPRRRLGRYPESHRRARQGAAQRLARRAARSGQDNEQRVFRPAVRPARRAGADLLADRGELPVVGRSVRDHYRLACGAGWHHLDVVRHAYRTVGAGAHRCHHVHGRGYGQLDPGGELLSRAPARSRAMRWMRHWKAVLCASARC